MGVAAECLLTLLCPEWQDGPEYHRRVVGATLIIDAFQDLRLLRSGLVQVK